MTIAAKDSSFLQGTSPIFDVFENDLQEAIGSAPGKAAVVLISVHIWRVRKDGGIYIPEDERPAIELEGEP